MAGRYKIFLGMAAGAGKTYRMLQEGHAEADLGRDVAIGLVETHGRAETTRLLEGLDAIAPRRVAYRGTTLDEMDLPAVLARAPELALVDELAHTNVPPPASSTPSATRTSTACSPRTSTCSPRSTCNTSRASTTPSTS